jgi:hypothetical protein
MEILGIIIEDRRKFVVKSTNSKAVSLLALTVFLMATIGCTGKSIRVGSLRSESESVELGSADSVDVEIIMGAGELDVAGGASDLLEADFTYNVEELEPDVDYKNDKLSVVTPSVENTGVGALWDLDDYRYEWELRLNDEVPMEMDITMGAGRSDLVLGSLSLTRLDLETGAGDVTLDLTGSASLTRLNVDAGVGEITVDLTGDWSRDLDADIKAGVGKLTILLPRDVGVRVDVEGGISDTDTRGLNRDGDAYVNDTYGESEVTLRVDIQAGIGDVNLEVGD